MMRFVTALCGLGFLLAAAVALAEQPSIKTGGVYYAPNLPLCLTEDSMREVLNREKADGKDAAIALVNEKDDCDFVPVTFMVVSFVGTVEINSTRTLTILEIDVGEPLHYFTFTAQLVGEGT